MTQAFLTLLFTALARTVPALAGETPQDREDRLAMARELFEAMQPADAVEAMQAAQAIAGSLAAMDAYARAARPGLSDETVMRLRASALSAGRAFDSLARARRKRQEAERKEVLAAAKAERAQPAKPPARLSDAVEVPRGTPAAAAPVPRPNGGGGTHVGAAPNG